MTSVEIFTSVVLFTIRDITSSNYRKLNEKKLTVFLIKDDNKYRLPSYKEDQFLSLDEAASKAVLNETNINDFFIEQLYTFSHSNEKSLILNPTYLGLIDYKKLKSISPSVSLFDCTFIDKKDVIEIKLNSENETIHTSIKKTLKPGSSDRYFFSEQKESLLKKGDVITIVSAMERLKNKVNYTDIIFNVMPKFFTLKELQQTFETIENKKLLDAAFRRIIATKVVETDEYLTGKGCRPSKLYTYKGVIKDEKN